MRNETVSLKVGDPLPKSLGRCADAYHEVRALRLQMDKEVKVIKDRESDIREHIIEKLSASDDTGVSGRRYKAQISIETKPIAADWEEIYDYVYRNDRFDLMGRSLNTKAVKEMWDAGKKIPGVEKIKIKTVSITKI